MTVANKNMLINRIVEVAPVAEARRNPTRLGATVFATR
jgi:hypothetical protein